MALDKSTFDTIKPSQFTTFTFPSPQNPTSLLRVAVLDSPTSPHKSDRVAAMFVPSGRESDWIFSTEPGHLQLLLAAAPSLSRLVLVGNHVIGDTYCAGSVYRRSEDNVLDLKPLFLALSPRSCFEFGIPEIPILRYEDSVVCIRVLGVFVGSSVGEMVVEDVEVGEVELRRRLRFKRMPNLVQTEVRLLLSDSNELSVDVGALVHPYLAPMVASLELISGNIEEKINGGSKPRALCLGVGGGALVSFLGARLGFDVLGVEEDEEVLRVGKAFFGLEEGESVELFAGDAMEFLERSVGPANKFDAVMVDLDSGDIGNRAQAPPMEFCRKRVLSHTRSLLADQGILVVNVVPHSDHIYEKIKCEFRQVYRELYEIDVGNEENFVLVATESLRTLSLSSAEACFSDKLRKAISGAFIDSIRKI